MGYLDPPSFSDRYRDGWVDGVRHALERVREGDPLEEIARAAQAIAEEADKRAKVFRRRRRTNGPGDAGA